ncbi:MAG: hypothetical protein C0594_05150 [Marinilabiliales bacterium]|nr:MAG: hypothetical protein C0594_05150 [Marinilabiliales bacterium]
MSKKRTKKEKQIHNKKRTQTETSKKLVNRLGVLLAIIAFLLYANTLKNGFVLDDFSVIKENWVVKKGTEGIPTILKTHYRYGYWNAEGVMYRPLSLIMFAVEWEMFYNEDTVNPFASHLINILLYALTAFVLFKLLVRMLRKYSLFIPFVATLLFIAHPLHTEVVANVKSRDEILAFLFAVLAMQWLWKYVDSGKLTKIILALLFFFLGFMSKEGVVTFLAVIPLSLYFFSELKLSRIAILSLLFLIPSVLFMTLRWKILGGLDDPSKISVADNLLVAAPDFLSQKATAIFIMGKYLLLLLFPYQLVSDYSYNQIPVTDFSNILVILSLLVHLAIVVVALVLFKRKHILSFAILFFFITFSLYTNLIILIGSSLGERFLYVPLLGFTLSLAFLISWFFKLNYEKFVDHSIIKFLAKLKAPLGIVAIILLLYSFKTINRNTEWESNNTLYAADVKKSDQSSHMHYHYGLSVVNDLWKKNNDVMYLDSAINEFKRAIKIYPHYADVYDQLGLAYFRKGDNENALKYYIKALEINPGKARVYSNMGIIYFNQKKYNKALEVYLKAIHYDPRYSDAYLNLGSTYGTLGQFDKAIESFLSCIQYDPANAQAHFFLGITYEKVGNMELAKQYKEKAYQLNPSLRR